MRWWAEPFPCADCVCATAGASGKGSCRTEALELGGRSGNPVIHRVRRWGWVDGDRPAVLDPIAWALQVEAERAAVLVLLMDDDEILRTELQER